MSTHYNLSIYDYSRNKLCDLYDSQVRLDGQAFGIKHDKPLDGLDTLEFNLPYQKGNNFRWEYMRSEYLVRLAKGNKKYWFVLNQPKKSKSGGEIVGTVNCESTATTLRSKNVYMEFDDTNGIGTIDELLERSIRNTGWTLGHVDPQYEKDGETEKVRSITSAGKEGSLELVTTICNIFKCRPEYDTDTNTINIYSLNNHNNVFEAEVGRNMEALTVDYNSKDITTRLYVEGEYGDYGYVGIDDVNPTGLTYLLNFDYYREIGAFTATHELVLQSYISAITSIKAQISAKQAEITGVENDANDLLGQCILALYYVADGFTTPKYTYGAPTTAQQELAVGDQVVVLNNNQTFRYATIETTPQALIQSGDFGIVKFVTLAAGAIGGKEVQIESKEKEIEKLEEKIESTTRETTIAEYRAEQAALRTEITAIYNGNTEEEGLYSMMYRTMKPDGIIPKISTLYSEIATLNGQQDTIEADFVIAMGGMLRDGYWQNQNYIVGQEQALYDDAIEVHKQMCRPAVTYELNYLRQEEGFGVKFEDLELNDIAHVNDDELDVHENLFIQKITYYIDNQMDGDIEISNQDQTLSSNSLSQLLSRMTQLADLIEQKNALYERAKAISKNGTIYADRLNGQIDVVKNQILSSVSNWYTDNQGNLIFLSADGGSAVMLSGAGMLLADGKTEDGEWNWRTALNGHGINADEIVAGFISAARIEAGSIATEKLEPDVGEKLTISNNPTILGIDARIELLPDQIVSYIGTKGYGKTYIQQDDPALEIDPETGEPKYTINEGDMWFEPQEEIEWEDVKETTWEANTARNWGSVYGYGTMHLRHDGEWQVVYDQSDIAEAYTQITQTNEYIKLEAVRAKNAEERLEASITLTAQSIQMDVIGLGRKTQYLQDDGKIMLEAFSVDSARGVATTAGITLDSNGRVTLSAANFDSLGESTSGVYITPTSISLQTGGSISMDAGTFNINGGSMNVNTGGSLSIAGGSFNVASGTVTISGGTMTIASGGSLTVSGGSITVSSEGTITINGVLNVNDGGSMNIDTTTTYEDPVTHEITYGYGGTLTGVQVTGKIQAQELYIGNTKAMLSLDSSGKLTLASIGDNAGTRLAATESGLSSEVTRAQGAESQLASSITQTANSVKVEVKGYTDTKTTHASIVASINDNTSAVKISADKIDFVGHVSITDLEEYTYPSSGPQLEVDGTVVCDTIVASSDGVITKLDIVDRWGIQAQCYWENITINGSNYLVCCGMGLAH